MKQLLPITLLLISSLAYSSSVYAQDDVQETFEVLKDFYKSTNGGYWTDNTGWDTTSVPASIEEFNDWKGLRIKYGELYEINLRSNNLTGCFPESLTRLEGLHVFMVSGNPMDPGPIPEWFSNTKIWV